MHLSLICFLVELIGLKQLLFASVFSRSGLRGKSCRVGRAVKEKVLTCFMFVATQVTCWLVVSCDSAEMSIQLKMFNMQAKDD